jgi:glycosyltransferase involved in cell wall biosynthesis
VRIALIAHHVAPLRPPFVGGVESFTWYLARWLAGRGHRVRLYAPPGTEVPGVDVRPLRLDAGLSDAARQDVSMPPGRFMDAHHAYLETVMELASSTEHDVVHSNTLHYLPIALGSLVGTPMVTTLHTPPTPWLESALRAAVRCGSPPALVAVSRATRDAWRSVTGPVPVVHNGVDTAAWRPGPGGGGAVWCGRIVPEKAPHLAIDACRRAGVPLRLAGPIIDRAYWDREIAPRVGTDAEHVGHLDHDALQAELGRARVAVVSPAWDEPFGLVAAEAMACGTPVAGFARGGLVRLVGRHGGRLVAPGDVPALARAIDAAAALDRAAVRRHVERTASLDVMGRAYERLYAATIGSGAAAVRPPAPVEDLAAHRVRRGRAVRPLPVTAT